jgi:predicted O-methyltransferase YrrM
MREKCVALERDKAQFCYLLIRAVGAKSVVEVSPSFGVSTIWLATGVRDNGGERGVVIATEKEPNKIARARENWEEAGLTGWIKLLEGDVLQTTKNVHDRSKSGEYQSFCSESRRNSSGR